MARKHGEDRGLFQQRRNECPHCYGKKWETVKKAKEWRCVSCGRTDVGVWWICYFDEYGNVVPELCDLPEVREPRLEIVFPPSGDNYSGLHPTGTAGMLTSQSV